MKFLGGLGIKKAYARNIALLTKRAWALQNNFNEIWAKTLRNKYPPHHSASKKTSVTCDSLLKANPIYYLIIGWRLGDGTSTKFWEDNWLGRGFIRNMIQGSLHRHENSLKVYDLGDQIGNWHLDDLSFHLPNHITDVIHPTPKPNSPTLFHSTY